MIKILLEEKKVSTQHGIFSLYIENILLLENFCVKQSYNGKITLFSTKKRFYWKRKMASIVFIMENFCVK